MGVVYIDKVHLSLQKLCKTFLLLIGESDGKRIVNQVNCSTWLVLRYVNKLSRQSLATNETIALILMLTYP